MNRCDWAEGSEMYIKYHDKEWGVPVFDDKILFEFLILETAQAGLSWSTILKRRDNYKEAYDNYDIEKIASYEEAKRTELLNNKGIIRNKLKIDASINNAERVLKIQEEYGSFSRYLWSFTVFTPVINKSETLSEVPAETELSKTIAKNLKKKGFKFVGSVTIYAFLQAVGIVNDHLVDCFRYQEVIDYYNKKVKDVDYLKEI
ncbi:MAG TPA: DNA-3-methyladenine glycosylase I [Halanaerobiales bacterium]|nr:DNA-3-methyladenine glycosylase I [Halanaerobiales bacterium]